MTYPQQPGPQQPQAPQQPAYQAPYGAPQAPQAPQQPAGYQYPQGYPQQPGYPQQSGCAPQPQGPSFLDTMNVRAVTKISAILMVVFIGIETFLSFLRLVDAGNNMSGFGYKLLFGSTPWLMLTAILAVWVIGLNVVQHGPQWFKMAAFVAMVAAAGLKVLAWLIYLFSGNSGYYGYGYSNGAATAIAWIGFFALLGLLAQVIVLLVGWLQQRV